MARSAPRGRLRIRDAEPAWESAWAPAGSAMHALADARLGGAAAGRGGARPATSVLGSCLLHGALIAAAILLARALVRPPDLPDQTVSMIFEAAAPAPPQAAPALPPPAPAPPEPPPPEPTPPPSTPAPPPPAPPPPAPTPPETPTVPTAEPAVAAPTPPAPRPVSPVAMPWPTPAPSRPERAAPARNRTTTRRERVPLSTPERPAPQTSAAQPQPAAPHASVTVPARPVAGLASNVNPAYPRAAKLRGEEGTVLLRITVTPNGAASSVTVARSSGSPTLDTAARDQVLLHWRFTPATRDGVPITDDRVFQSMTFTLTQ